MSKVYRIVLQGITPYMQHRMDDKKLEDWEKTHKPTTVPNDASKEDVARAEYHCYRTECMTDDIPAGLCYMPKEHIKSSLIKGAAYVRGRVGSSTKSMKSTVAGQFFIMNNILPLPDYDAIDKRSAVNNNVKARVMVVRPKWTQWSVEFNLHVDNDTIAKEMIIDIIRYSGSNVGTGSFRPEKNGEFGRYKLVSIEEVDNVEL